MMVDLFVLLCPSDHNMNNTTSRSRSNTSSTSWLLSSMFHQLSSSSSSSSSSSWYRRLAALFLVPTTTTTTTFVSGLDPLLVKRAAQLRSKISTTTKENNLMTMIPTYDDLYYPSSYRICWSDTGGLNNNKRRRRRPLSFSCSNIIMNNNDNDENDNNNEYYMRGFCNWILPNQLMVGQYPGETPETYGPSSDEVETHIESMITDAGVTLFICLQDELPCQSDYVEWQTKLDGKVYLQDDYWKQEFPNPFKHYASVVDDVVKKYNDYDNDSIQYWHTPIEDLSVPKDNTELQKLLLKIVDYLLEEDNSRCIYLHCWGGRGRTGLVSACLLSLLYPELDSNTILNWIQFGYDSRLGSDQMPLALSKSPQTESQKSFVRSFVNERRRQQQMA